MYVFNAKIRKLEQVSKGSHMPRPGPLPNENKGLMQNFDVKIDERCDV